MSAPRKPHVEAAPKEPHVKCGAKLKSGKGLCSKGAGWRTNHPGQGKCYFHGGATPIKSGMYSGIQRPELREKIDKFAKQEDPYNLEPELALLRAIVEDLVERWDKIYGPDGALLAWHESFNTDNPTPKPRQMPDFSSVSMVVDRIGKLVERIQRFKKEGAISLMTLNSVVEQMGAELVGAIQELHLDADTSAGLLATVERRWQSIKLDAGRSSSSRDQAKS
mgnify:CR=1 FL=1